MRVSGKNMVITGIRAFSAAFVALAVCVMFAVPAALAAGGPEWSAGFPRLVEANVLLQWNPVSGATEYKIYRAAESDKEPKLLDTVKVNRHIDKDVPTGSTLTYYISAVVAGKEGARSKPQQITTAKKTVFVPLKQPKLAGGHVKTSAAGKPSIGIRWEGGAGSELVGYNVYRSKKKGAGYTLIGSTASTAYDDEAVSPGDTYYYVVTSLDSNFTETKYSNEIEVNVPKPEVVEKAAKDVVPPTKVRATKVLFTIPSKTDLEDISEGKTLRNPLPGNAQDVVVDEAVGHIYVTSYEYGGLLVYDMLGRFQYGIRKDGVNGKEKFGAAENVALGPNGDVYMTDYTAPDIYVFDYQGKLKDTIRVDISHVPGKKGVDASLYGIDVAEDGTIYVGDPRSNRVYGYDYRKKRVMEVVADKKKNLEFNGPSFLLVNPDGDITFTDAGFSRLQTVDKQGKFLRIIGKKGLGAGCCYYPVGLARGNKGEIFQASALTPNIQAFNTKGEFMYVLGNEKLDGPPPLVDMRGIYVDSQDRVYVTEGMMNRVTVLQMLDKYQETVPEK